MQVSTQLAWQHSLLSVFFVLGSLACDSKGREPPREEAMATATTSSPAPPQNPEPPQKPWFSGEWRADLKIVPKQMTPKTKTEEKRPSRGQHVGWVVDKGKEAVGAATLELTLDDDGSARGKAEGVLGTLRVIGELTEEALLLRFEGTPAALDHFNGSATCQLKKDALPAPCKLFASTADANLVRTSEFSLSKKAVQ